MCLFPVISISSEMHTLTKIGETSFWLCRRSF